MLDERPDLRGLLDDWEIALGYPLRCVDVLDLPERETAAGAPPCRADCAERCACEADFRARARLKGSAVFACLGGRTFLRAALFLDTRAVCVLVMGPLRPGETMDARRVRALQTTLKAMSSYLREQGIFPKHKEAFVKLSCHIDDHMAEELSCEALAGALYLSGSALANAVKTETGMPLRRYIQFRRLEAARRMLLTTSLPIMRIAENCGISDFNYFSRVFKKTYGVSPGKYRNPSAQS